jgi:hypothetical protein
VVKNKAWSYVLRRLRANSLRRRKSALAAVRAAVLAGVLVCAQLSAAINGPLRVHPTNPRYFTDNSGRAIYLAGSHTWNTLLESGSLPTSDYSAYLDFLKHSNHNFTRLWSHYRLQGIQVPYVRSGPGTALDGQPRVDLDRLDQAYFDRLRRRVVSAGDRGIYVAIMLFNPDGAKPEDWSTQLFHPLNNIQAINADSNGDGRAHEIYDLSNARITKYQEAYVRTIIDTVNDLDNVIYEIGNEGFQSSTSWQYHFIDFIRNYEAGKPKQHVIGMTSFYEADNVAIFSSSADWISPADVPGQNYSVDLPPNDVQRTVILDTDHLGNNNELAADIAADGPWVWKSFLRGYHVALMDRVGPAGTKRERARVAIGQTRSYSEKIDLANVTPRGDLTSTGYALAHPGSEYLVYTPPGANFTLDLEPGSYNFEWFDPSIGLVVRAGSFTTSAGNRSFTPPFSGEAVLFLKMSDEITTTLDSCDTRHQPQQ